jgi:hypothetical protein
MRCGLLDSSKDLFLSTEPRDPMLRVALRDQPKLLGFVYRQVGLWEHDAPCHRGRHLGESRGRGLCGVA